MKNLKEQIEIILIQMMPVAPSYPTASLAEEDRISRIKAIEKAKNRILNLIKPMEDEIQDYFDQGGAYIDLPKETRDRIEGE